MHEHSISVIVVNYNTAFLLHELISTLTLALTGVRNNIIIVDNDSKDDSVEIIKRDFPGVRLIENTKNVGFGRANNQALPYADGEFVLLLNTDAFVRPDTIVKSLQYMQLDPKCGVLGAKLCGRDGSLQASARFFPTPWNAFVHRSGLKSLSHLARMVDDPDWNPDKVTKCDWVPGCYYMVRRQVISQVGLFDPRYFLYFEEVDHCFATKQAGWDVVCFSETTVIHIGGESAKSDGPITQSGRQLQALQIESELLYFRKNHGFISVLADVLLMSLANGVSMGRLFFKRNSSESASDLYRRTLLIWSLFMRTRCGTLPTR